MVLQIVFFLIFLMYFAEWTYQDIISNSAKDALKRYEKYEHPSRATSTDRYLDIYN